MKAGAGFSAGRIAIALGSSARSVRRRLAGFRSTSEMVRGQSTRHYLLEDLPEEYRRKLWSKARKASCRTISDYLARVEPRWEPAVGLSAVSCKSIAEAQAKLDVMAPQFQRRQHEDSKSAMARATLASLQLNPDFSMVSARTVSRWIDQVLERDRGHEEYERVELYLSECAVSPSPPAARPELPSLLSASDERLWETACYELQRLTSEGMPERAVRKLIVPVLVERLGITTREAARKSLERKYRRWLDGGCSPSAFSDRRPGNSGRKPLVTLTPSEQADVQRLVLQTDPTTSTRISTSLALRLYAHSDACREEVADVILKKRASKHTVTPTLKKQARITAETKMLHRGERTFALHAYSQPRDLTWTNPAHQRLDLLAGDLFERDDMTVNQPWWVEWDGRDGSDPCAEKYGVRLLRGQLLMQIDVASQRALSFELLARPHDSYRADDIWAWIGRGYRDTGLPRVGERMERGIWEAKAIHGIPIAAGQWEQGVRLGGLGALGVRHIPSYSPKTKSIENFFNLLQNVLGIVGPQVGRKRGEFERETKDWNRCRAGKVHPAECGFLHADELVKRIDDACKFLNSDCREGEVYRGIPDELWTEQVNEKTPLATLTGRDAWIFAPEKRPAQIFRGMVKCKFAAHQCSYHFQNPEVFAALGSGHKVVVCFDPAMPDLGATIFNADTRSAHRPGELLCAAELSERVPQYCAPDGCDDEAGYDRRRRFSTQCRKAYRSIALPGRNGASATIARDSHGNESRVESHLSPGVEHAPKPSPPESEAVRLFRAANRQKEEEWDERAELDRIERLEREAFARGDFLVNP